MALWGAIEEVVGFSPAGSSLVPLLAFPRHAIALTLGFFWRTEMAMCACVAMSASVILAPYENAWQAVASKVRLPYGLQGLVLNTRLRTSLLLLADIQLDMSFPLP